MLKLFLFVNMDKNINMNLKNKSSVRKTFKAKGKIL